MEFKTFTLNINKIASFFCFSDEIGLIIIKRTLIPIFNPMIHHGLKQLPPVLGLHLN